MSTHHLYPGVAQPMYGGSLSRAFARGGVPPERGPMVHHQQQQQQTPQQRLPILQQQSGTHAAAVMAWDAQVSGEGPGGLGTSNGRIIGLIRTPTSNMSYPYTPTDQMANLGQDVHGEPVYSCQGLLPQGPAGRVYQCLGHGKGEDIHHGGHRELEQYQSNSGYPDSSTNVQVKCQTSVSVDHSGNPLDVRDHRYSLRTNNIEHVYPQLQYSNSLQHRKEKRRNTREAQVQKLEQSLEERLNPSIDPRSVYHYSGSNHYSGSEYSSIEPLYMQRYPCHSEVGHKTPSLGSNRLRASSRGRGSSRGTRSELLDRSGSSSNSTASSTLPAVSALLMRDASAHGAPIATHSMQSLRVSLSRHNKGGDNITPSKLKRQGLFGAWKVQFLRGDGSHNKSRLLLAAIIFIIILVLGIIATIIYLALGGDLSFLTGSTSAKLVDLTETGNSVINGEFLIINHNFQPAFANENSEPFRYIAESIEHELDEVFSSSPSSMQYNHSRVLSLSPVPLLVMVQIILVSADETAAHKFGSSFLKGLNKKHDQYWLGPYKIDINSVRFSENLLGSSTLSTTDTTSASSTISDTKMQIAGIHPTPYINVGWGSWGSWSTCSPCAPQYDQVRTRQCRLDAGRGLLINTIEPCLPSRMSTELQGSVGDMESRSCQCNQNIQKSDIDDTTNSPLPIYSTTEFLTSGTTTVSTSISTTTQLSTTTKIMKTESNPSHSGKEHACGWCLPEQVCVALQGEDHPRCREPLDVTDTSGCGGLCILESEVCQSTGELHAFKCQVASQCLVDEWRCKDGLCIPSTKRCDGHMNCYDRSDEDNCAENITPSRNSSLTLSHGSKTDQINSLQYLDGIKSTSINIASGATSTADPPVIGGTPVVMTGMNRTAIGLLSLSHRERELLS